MRARPLRARCAGGSVGWSRRKARPPLAKRLAPARAWGSSPRPSVGRGGRGHGAQHGRGAVLAWKASGTGPARSGVRLPCAPFGPVEQRHTTGAQTFGRVQICILKLSDKDPRCPAHTPGARHDRPGPRRVRRDLADPIGRRGRHGRAPRTSPGAHEDDGRLRRDVDQRRARVGAGRRGREGRGRTTRPARSPRSSRPPRRSP